MELPSRAGEFYGSIRATLSAEGSYATTICGLPRMPALPTSFWSPTTNASFDAFKGWKFRTGRT